jgi:hypothetical protein
MIKSKSKWFSDSHKSNSGSILSNPLQANFSQLLLPGLLIVLTGCNPGNNNVTESGNPVDSQNGVKIEEAKTDSKTQQPSQRLFAPQNETLAISTEGIGEAKLGMKFGELKKQLSGKAQFSGSEPFMVDFSAIAVSKEGEVHYYIIHPESEPFTDESTIELLLTDNPKFRTTEGIAPGMAVSQGELVYGEAKLAYNTEGESREYIYFAKSPGENMSFRSNGNTEKLSSFAGVYPSSNGESYYETKEFRDDAAISSIMVSN